ncbi:MAG: hypothetical protein M1120_03840 [Patescibacteria group bacterium]|nr:hypothetical protein [Patescibacteria group bacterium]
MNIESKKPFITDTELQVLALVNKGLSSKEIAQILYYRPHSIENMLTRHSPKDRKRPGLFARLGVSDRKEAVKRARELGLLKD